MPPLLEIPVNIEQINSSKGRFYTEGKKKYPSVTSVIDRFEDKTGLFNWQVSLGDKLIPKEQRVNFTEEELIAKAYTLGKVEANKTRDKAAVIGTKKHKQIDTYVKNPQLYPIKEWEAILGKFLDFLQLTEPLAVEFKVFYETTLDIEGKVVSPGQPAGFGGTFDHVGRVDGSRLIDRTTCLKIYEGMQFAMTDWKNTTKAKYPKGRNKNGQVYYPLLRYALQISAYLGAFNKYTQGYYKLNRGYIVMCHPGCKAPFIYYFDPEAINWYWLNFRKMLAAYFFSIPFDWNKFARESDARDLLGKRVDILK